MENLLNIPQCYLVFDLPVSRVLDNVIINLITYDMTKKMPWLDMGTYNALSITNFTGCCWLYLTSCLWSGRCAILQCHLLNSSMCWYIFSSNYFGCCRVEYLVLDESDKLFEPELFKQIDSIIKACSNPSIIRSLFSATLPDFVEDRARELMHDAVRVIVGRK